MCARRARSRKTARSPMSASAPHTADFRKRRQAAFDALRQQLKNQVPQKTSGASFPSWPAYVRSQAALGDAEAIALLQRWRTRSQRQNPSPFRNAPSDPRAPRCEATAGTLSRLMMPHIIPLGWSRPCPRPRSNGALQAAGLRGDDGAPRANVWPVQLAGQACRGPSCAYDSECGFDPIRGLSPSLSSGAWPSAAGAYLPALELDPLEIPIRGKRSKRVSRAPRRPVSGRGFGPPSPAGGKQLRHPPRQAA